jgi:ribosomal protein S18 acetylase RimI-like enzyme
VEELIDDEAVLAACGGDPLIAHLLHTRVPGGPNAWRLGDATAILFDLWEAPILAIAGDRDAGRLALALAESRPGAYALLPERFTDALGEVRHVEVGFCCVDRPLPADGAAGEWLAPAAAPEIDDVLDAGFPDASMRPTSPFVRRWAGVRVDGQLVACIADASPRQDMGYVGSLAVHPAYRRRRLGDRLLRWTVNEVQAERRRVGLWWHDEDTVTRDWYGRLGFALRPVSTGRLRGDPAGE